MTAGPIYASRSILKGMRAGYRSSLLPACQFSGVHDMCALRRTPPGPLESRACALACSQTLLSSVTALIQFSVDWPTDGNIRP